MLKRYIAAALAALRNLVPTAKAAPQQALAALQGMGRTRLLWLAGAILLVVAGLGLALVSGSPSDTNAGIEVKLPPIGGKPALLAPAPDPALVETSPIGPLPIVGPDGRQPWQVYARPFDITDKRPRIALVVTGIGLNRDVSQAALDRLPGPVTLAFDAYAATIKEMVATARSLGHETLIGMPMEPIDYPRQDPGPLTLLASLEPGDNIARLNHLLGESTGYVGVVAILGERFTQAKASLLPIIETIKKRGLMFVDNKTIQESATIQMSQQLKLPWAGANRAIDAEADPAAIDQAFADLENQARRNGTALGLAALSPALIDRASSWVAGLEAKGFALAPASAIANRQTVLLGPP